MLKSELEWGRSIDCPHFFGCQLSAAGLAGGNGTAVAYYLYVKQLADSRGRFTTQGAWGGIVR
jgi:hypothetical protein